MDPEMCERGKLVQEAFESLMDVLRAWGVDRATPQAIPPERNKGVSTAITPHKAARVPPAGPVKPLGGDDVRLSSRQRSIDKLHDLILSHGGNQQDGSRPARGKEPGRQSGVRAASITFQSVSVPREHEVSF